MKVRYFDFEKDYENIVEWYKKWKYLPISKETMPPHGLIVSNAGYDIGAAWLYITNARVALIEGAIMNPNAPRTARKGAHAFIIEAMKYLAKDLGCIDLWVICKDKYLTTVCEESGFTDLKKDFKVLITRL